MAVVIVLSIVLTISFVVYNKVINNSKDKSFSISMDNIKSATELYSKENNDVSNWWRVESSNSSYMFKCVTVQDLINSGYFGDDLINKSIKSDNNISNNSIIKIVKNADNMTIIKTEITNETSIDSCNQEISNSIPVSSSGEYIITYNYNNGNNTKTIVRIEKGKSLNLLSLSNSINTGYIFNGWFSTKFGEVKVGDGGTSITPPYDMTLFAHWVPS